MTTRTRRENLQKAQCLLMIVQDYLTEALNEDVSRKKMKNANELIEACEGLQMVHEIVSIQAEASPVAAKSQKRQKSVDSSK
jgi:hypothetical protein